MENIIILSFNSQTVNKIKLNSTDFHVSIGGGDYSQDVTNRHNDKIKQIERIRNNFSCDV